MFELHFREKEMFGVDFRERGIFLSGFQGKGNVLSGFQGSMLCRSPGEMEPLRNMRLKDQKASTHH